LLISHFSPERAPQRRVPEEKGPFGRALGRRGLSRSKTFTPTGARKEDKDAQENWKAIDEIFQKAKENTTISEKQDTQTPVTSTPAGVPTEVLLYGFGEVYQWSAIEFYERVSLGLIYEDYDRTPPNPRYNQSLSQSVLTRGVRIPPEALRKVNQFHGGVHWIKVTFDSAEAADRACHASPHRLNGYLVFAERYRGIGPNTDAAIPATAEALRGLSASPSQNSTSSTILNNGNGSVTASSATATAPSQPVQPPLDSQITSSSLRGSGGSSTAISTPQRALLRGAKRVVLLPADKAVLPATSRWQKTFGGLPLVGFVIGGSHNDMIGDQVPLKDDGEFDWEKASLYWQFWALLDYYIFFANFLGLKGDE